MLTNGATAAVVAVAVDGGLDVPPPAPPGDPDEPHPASMAASPAPHNVSTATLASGRLTVPSHLANSINPSSQHQQYWQ
jgi:hypothetical protein